jgi:3-hydroxyisobutyrate dehydrogenase
MPRAGLDLAVVAETIATSQAASPQVVRNTARMLSADHERNIVFTAALRLKDVEYGLEFARSLGIGAPFGALAEHVYRRLCTMGHAQLNESKVIDVARAHTSPSSEG